MKNRFLVTYRAGNRVLKLWHLLTKEEAEGLALRKDVACVTQYMQRG